jgi:endonuclease III
MGFQSQRSERLAKYVRELGDQFKYYVEIDGNYEHIGATIADAILQANRDYEKIVRPRVNAIRKKYAEKVTTSALYGLLNSIAVCEFMNYNGKDRADRFRAVLDLFRAESIETCDELRCWLALPGNRKKLLAIRGVGPKTADYFKILVGLPTAAPDIHLNDFLEEAEISYENYNDAKKIINNCADILQVDRAHFDHSVWQYRRRKRPVREPRYCVATAPIIS